MRAPGFLNPYRREPTDKLAKAGPPLLRALTPPTATRWSSYGPQVAHLVGRESRSEMGVGQLVYGLVFVAVAGVFFLTLHLYLAPVLYLTSS